MDAKKCTRCGKYYEECPITPFEALGKSIKRLAAAFSNYQWAREIVIEKLEQELDLCPACRKSLNKWMKEGAKNEQKERASDGYNAGEVFIDELHTGPEQ